MIEEVTYGPQHTKMLRKLKTKKRNARGRRVQKLKAMRLQAFVGTLTIPRDFSKTKYREIDCTHLVPQIHEVDCRTICPDLGACCRKLALWVKGTPWPATEDPIEAQDMIDNYPDGALPFELLAHAQTTTGTHAWYLRCKMVRRDGLCGIYEHRPEVCRSFQQENDCLCVLHPGHKEAKALFETGIGQLIAEETPEA